MDLIENPGCYGLPTAVSAGSASCRACAMSAGCVHSAFEFLDTLPVNPLTQRERQLLTVTKIALTGTPRGQGEGQGQGTCVASSRGVKRLVLSQAQLGEIERLPARVASQVKQLVERGWFEHARRELRAGRNPAGKGWKKVLCEALLGGGTSRQALELAFVQQLGMTPGSAKVQASVGMAIFAYGRVATETMGKIALNPN